MAFVISSCRMVDLTAEGFLVDLERWADTLFSVRGDGRAVADFFALDIEDIRSARNGDSEAYRRLVERHQQHISKILWRFSRDVTVHEELVQDVFVEAYLSLRSYKGKAPFEHWLSRIATRVGYHYWKMLARQRHTIGLCPEHWDQISRCEPREMDTSDAASLLYELLAQLPVRDRLVLTLRYFDCCDIAQIAQRTGWTKSMVKVQAFRARKKLKKLFLQAQKEFSDED